MDTRTVRDGSIAWLRGFALHNSILLLLLLMFAGAALLAPGFLSLFNVKNLLLQSVDIMIISVGVTFVVLNGGIDFSCVAVLALGSVFGAWVMAQSPVAHTALAIPAGIVAMMVIGLVVGAINGFSVVVLKMPSFIATLATMMAGGGVAVWFTSLVAEKASIIGLPEPFFILGGEQGYILVPVIIALALILLGHWLLSTTLFGRRVYAVGTNPKAAFISGMPVKRTVFLLMLVSGLLAGIQSVIATARNQAGVPSLGDRIFIDIVASIIIGGTSIFGGSGGVIKTVYGVLFITLLNNVVNLLGIEWYVISLIKGILVLIAAFIDVFSKRVDLVRR
jgi:ribose/xylose/arabinose/galactoside ABC-type transport system permease subunit